MDLMESKKRTTELVGSGETSQWLRALAAPSTQVGNSQPPVTLALEELIPSSGHFRHPHNWHTLTHRYRHTHKNKMK